MKRISYSTLILVITNQGGGICDLRVARLVKEKKKDKNSY